MSKRIERLDASKFLPEDLRQMQKKAKGTIVKDPFDAFPNGESIQFKRVQFASSDATRRAEAIKNWEYFNGAVLAVVLKSQGRAEMIGTAVMVAPGLAFMATHIISGWLDAIPKGGIQCYCIGIREQALDIWRIAKINYAPDNDITLLSIEAASSWPEDRTYHVLGVTTRAPMNGETLHIVGFRQESFDIEPRKAAFRAALLASCGEVAAVYPYRRDGVMLPFPVIEISCGSLGGMSGGAALDQNGLLVGVISSGLHSDEGDGPTYVSWIIRALGRPVELTWPRGLHRAAASPLTMDRRLIYIDRPEAMTGTNEKEMIYEIWFG